MSDVSNDSVVDEARNLHARVMRQIEGVYGEVMKREQVARIDAVRDEMNVDLLRLMTEDWVIDSQCYRELLDVHEMFVRNGFAEPWKWIKHEHVLAYSFLYPLVGWVCSNKAGSYYDEYFDVIVTHGKGEIRLMALVLEERKPETAEDFKKILMDIREAAAPAMSSGVL